MNTILERLARLETQMGHVEQKLTTVETGVGDIRSTQLEIRDELVGRRAVRSAAKTGIGVLKAVAPTVVAVGAAAATSIGLRW